MRNQYKHIEKAPVSYITNDGEIKKRYLVPINDVQITNSFNVPKVRGIVGLFNAVISRFMYFAMYDGSGKERNRPMSQTSIYLPGHQISRMINRCESQCFNIKDQLERIFDLDITRAHEKFGANKFRLSQRVDEFLYVFTPEQLNQFMEKYNITDSEDVYRLKQLYNYRVVRPSDANMTPEQYRDFKSFMSERRHDDFNHMCSTNNVTYQSRVESIEIHIDLLSSRQKEQLHKIKKALASEGTKLLNKLHWKLLELQQFVTMMLKKRNITKKSNLDDQEYDIQSQFNNRNKNEAEQQKTHDIAAQHLKDPEEPSLRDVVQIATYWNIMALDRRIEFMYTLSDSKIQSINKLVKLYGKDTILNAIENTGNLLLNSILTFDSFKKESHNPDSRFQKIVTMTEPDTRLSEDHLQATNQKRFKFWTNHSSISHDNVPSFNSKAEAKSWFKNASKHM